MLEYHLKIGDPVRVIKSNYDIGGSDYGRTAVIDYIDIIGTNAALLLDFGKEYPFTHDGRARLVKEGNIHPHDKRHYRWYWTDSVEPVAPELEFEITEEEFNQCLQLATTSV